MAFTVVYDACALYSETLRDFLIRLAHTSVVSGRWTERIVNEVAKAVVENHPELRERFLAPGGTRDRMLIASREGPVENYQHLEASFGPLPDPGDAHVIAAAVVAGAQVIVTFNLQDFPAEVLAPHFIEAQDPDTYVLGLVDLESAEVLACLEAMSRARRRYPSSVPELMEALERHLPKSIEALRPLLRDEDI